MPTDLEKSHTVTTLVTTAEFVGFVALRIVIMDCYYEL